VNTNGTLYANIIKEEVMDAMTAALHAYFTHKVSTATKGSNKKKEEKKRRRRSYLC
jgi:hypothetical protein